MSDYPDRLRAARERLGLSVEDISERTRIKADMLRALERGDTSRLPGPFYTRAFIRTYAREVGLPAAELAADFAATEQPPSQPAVRLEDIPPVSRIARFEAPRASSWQLLPIALVVAAVVFWGSRRPADPVRSAGPDAVGTTGVSATSTAATMGSSATGVPAATDRITIVIRPSGPVWVSADADGTRVIYRLLNPGERTVVEARDAIALRVGDAAAFVYTINGADGLMLGAPGEVRDIRITRENFASFRR